MLSAGRIPSEGGFPRYYVDWMMEKENLSDEEMEVLEKLLNENIRDWGDIARAWAVFDPGQQLYLIYNCSVH